MSQGVTFGISRNVFLINSPKRIFEKYSNKRYVIVDRCLTHLCVIGVYEFKALSINLKSSDCYLFELKLIVSESKRQTGATVVSTCRLPEKNACHLSENSGSKSVSMGNGCLRTCSGINYWIECVPKYSTETYHFKTRQVWE